MNILFFASSHKIGLTGQLFEQALAFRRIARGNFFFVSGENEQFPGLFDKFKDNSVPFRKIKGLDEHSRFFALAVEIKACVDELQPDFVTVQTNWQMAIAVAVKYLYRKKFAIVYSVNGYRHNYRFRSYLARYLIGAALYFFADRVVTPSSFLRDKFCFLGNKNEIIFLGEDKALFVGFPKPDFNDIKRLIFPGEFRTGKNQDLLIRSLKRYIEQSGNDKVELYLPGKGETLEPCRCLAQELGIGDKVFFPGFIDRAAMLDLYLRCQFALVPSNIETFGHCIAEPIILGRVVISRKTGVAGDVIRHGETGFFFEDEDGLLGVLLKVLPDRQLCEVVSANTAEFKDAFRWETICQQYFEKIYTHRI